MNISIACPVNNGMEKYFPEAAINALKELGNLKINDTGRIYSAEELIDSIKDADICVTHWKCPQINGNILKNADRLKLIAHTAGSVAPFVTDDVYKKSIKVCSANNVMAKYVAEGTLAYILAGLRLITRHDRSIKNKKYERYFDETKSLFGGKIGLIGLGTVGRYLLDLLKPFDVQVKIYDPYISRGVLKEYSNVEICSLEETLAWGSIISIHASLTPETYQMLKTDELKCIKKGALLVNTARAAVIDEKALTDELKKGRISAVLDVFEEEPLPKDSPLRDLENVVLMPHMAGVPAREQMTYAMIDEIERFIKGEPLIYEIPYDKYKLMTRTVH